jgi:hypothetical protein
MNTHNKEKGQASIKIILSKGIITVKHGTDGAILSQWTAEAGDWDRIWEVIRALQNGNAVAIKEF